MSRSKHTDPKTIRAARRLNAPRGGRGGGDLSRRRKLGRQRKDIGANAGRDRDKKNGQPRLRITMRQPRIGFIHPASKQDILGMLKLVGPVGPYGLRTVEFARSPAESLTSAPIFGRYFIPGRIVLFEQPVPPWRLPGLLKPDVARRLKDAGAVLTSLADVGATLVDWPEGTLRRFMLEEAFLHELGHHVLQHHKGKRSERIVRTRHHEASAPRFA